MSNGHVMNIILLIRRHLGWSLLAYLFPLLYQLSYITFFTVCITFAFILQREIQGEPRIR